MKYRSSQLEPHNCHSCIRTELKINEMWVWQAGALELSFLDERLIENQWNLGLVRWSTKIVILSYEFNWKSLKYGSGKFEPHTDHFLIRIQLKIDEIWSLQAGVSLNKDLIDTLWNLGVVSWAPEWSLFHWNWIENQWNLGLASCSPTIIISW